MIAIKIILAIVIALLWSLGFIVLYQESIRNSNAKVEKRFRLHLLSNHPITEMREGIPSDKVVVDEQYKDLFSSYEPYGVHIVVSKREYLNIKAMRV